MLSVFKLVSCRHGSTGSKLKKHPRPIKEGWHPDKPTKDWKNASSTAEGRSEGMCPECGVVEDVEHLLIKCRLWGRERQIHLGGNPGLGILNKEPVMVLDFMRAIGRTAAPTLWCCAPEWRDLGKEEEEAQKKQYGETNFKRYGSTCFSNTLKLKN